MRTVVPGQSVRNAPIHGDFLICAATFGNGATIFTEWTIIRPALDKTPRARNKAKPKWFAAGPGGSVPITFARRIVTTKTQVTPMSVSDTTSMVFAVLGRTNHSDPAIWQAHGYPRSVQNVGPSVKNAISYRLMSWWQ